MRSDTYTASAHLIWHLKYYGVVAQIQEDGGDIILLDLVAGQRVMIHLIDQAITLSEIRDNLDRASQQNVYTLYTFWCDMLLPPEGKPYLMDDWMEVLLDLHKGVLYGFEVAGRHVYFFPLYFEGEGRLKVARFGDIVDYAALNAYETQANTPFLSGWYRIAGFTANAHQQKRPRYQPQQAPLEAAFALLGLHPSADFEAVKAAYRRLARAAHPDVNTSASATEEMQRLNAAYALLTRHFNLGDE